MGKRHLHVMIDESLYELAVREAAVRFGAMRGSLSMLVEEALKAYLTGGGVVVVKPRGGRVKAVYDAVKDRLVKARGYGDIKQVTLSELQQAIEDVRGTDERTVRKWISLFIQHKYIKPLPEYNNMVYELLA